MTDVNFLAADFVWKLNGTGDRHAPIEKLKPREIKLRLKPWITSDIQKLLKVRDNLFERKKRQPDNDHVKQAYNTARNRVTRELKRSKTEHHRKNFETLSSNIKKTWDAIS